MTPSSGGRTQIPFTLYVMHQETFSSLQHSSPKLGKRLLLFPLRVIVQRKGQFRT